MFHSSPPVSTSVVPMVCRYQLRCEVSPEISQVADTIYTKYSYNCLYPKGVQVWLLYPAFDFLKMSESIITSKLEGKTLPFSKSLKV